jgi:hypothetical protein
VEEFEPYYTQTYVLVGLVCLMMYCLRYQSIHGGRSILPGFMQPAKYNYFIKFDPEKIALKSRMSMSDQSREVYQYKVRLKTAAVAHTPHARYAWKTYTLHRLRSFTRV